MESLKKICMAISVVAVLAPMSVFAASGTGCEEGLDNEYISPELALCTTHVYNIGGDKNPDNDAQREIMKDVVALKTTVMTQQMYKQYEYLESMMKRFKTQLEKAVLTTKLEAAGAGTNNSSSDNSSFKSSDRTVVLESAKNCNNETTKLDVYECLQGNITTVLNAVDDNKISDAKRQLESDIKVATGWGINKPSECNSLSGSTRLRDCAYALRRVVVTATDDYNKTYRTMQQMK